MTATSSQSVDRAERLGPGGETARGRFYRVLVLIHESGERYPVLIGNDGIPPSLALRYSFRLRLRGSSSVFEQIMRDLGALYEYVRTIRSVDLDNVLREGRALRDCQTITD